MKQRLIGIISSVLIFAIMECCSEQKTSSNNLNEVDTVKVSFYKKYKYPLTDFGFVISDELEPGSGINSLTFNDNFVFLTDGAFKDIKRIDVSSGSFLMSSKLDEWPADIQFCDTNLLVLGSDSLMFVTDQNFRKFENRTIPRGGDFFYRDSSDLFVYRLNGNTLRQIDCKTIQVTTTRSTNGILLASKNTTRGKSFEIDSIGILTAFFGKIRLRTMHQNMNRYYPAVNLDFDTHTLVQYGIESDSLFVEIYRW